MKQNRPGSPLFATINVTGSCNLRCKYCFYQPRSDEHMSLQDFQHVIDELVGLNVFFVNLSGGEPFMHPQISDMLAYAHDKFSHAVVLSNGTLINPSHFDTIQRIVAKKGGFPIQISLDSISADVNKHTRGDAKKILRNIAELSEIGADIVIAMVITRYNASTLIDSISHLSQYTRYFHLMTVQQVPALNGEDVDYPLSEEDQAVLWSELADLRSRLNLSFELPCEESAQPLGSACGAPCMAAFSQLVIDPNLNVRPCDRCVQTVLGNLHHISVSDVWNGRDSLKIIESPIPYCKVEN